MKIKVPAYTLEHNMTDNEKVFCAFMGFISSNYSVNHVRYFMYSDDIKHILAHTKEHKSKNRVSTLDYKNQNWTKELDTIREVFNIGFINSHTWSVEFKTAEPKYISRNGKYILKETDIEDLNAIKCYYYLVGRLSGTEQIIDDGVKIETKYTHQTTVLHRCFEDHFMI